MATKQEILDHLVARTEQFGPNHWDAEPSICDHFVRAASLPPVRPAVSYRHELDDADSGETLAFGQDVTGAYPTGSREVRDYSGEAAVRAVVRDGLAALVDEGRLEIRGEEGHVSYHVVPVEQS